MKDTETNPNEPLREALSGEELETVAGGGCSRPSSFKRGDEGKWYVLKGEGGYAYRVYKAYDIAVIESVYSYPAALLDRFRIDGSEAWFCGTVTEVANASYGEIQRPATVHDDKQYPSVL